LSSAFRDEKQKGFVKTEIGLTKSFIKAVKAELILRTGFSPDDTLSQFHPSGAASSLEDLHAGGEASPGRRRLRGRFQPGGLTRRRVAPYGAEPGNWERIR